MTAVIRDGRRAAERVHHHAQLDQVLVDWGACGLDHEDVRATNVLVDLERDFRVRKTQQPRLAQLHAKELANLSGERPMGASRKQF